MTTINLYQDQDEQKEGGGMLKMSSSVLYPIAFLIFTLVVLAGFKVVVYFTQNNNQKLTKEVESESIGFSGQEDVQNIIDTQKRLKEIKANLDARKTDDVNLPLDNISAEITSGVVLTSYKYNAGKITAIFNANNFADISKQLFNLKKSKNFLSVNLGSLVRVENGIDMTVDMSFGNEIAKKTAPSMPTL